MKAAFINLKKTEYTILDEKSQFYMSELNIIDFVYDLSDRSSETAKIIKILEWSFYCNISKIRAFINVCVYYRI